MDPRLMPPSHFDPNEQDSLEVTPPIRCGFSPTAVHRQGSGTGIGNMAEQYLVGPVEFSSPALNPCLGNHQSPLMSAERPQHCVRQPDSHQVSPQVSKSEGLERTPLRNDYPTSRQNRPEMLRLQAENDALKLLIQSTKTKFEPQLSRSHQSSSNAQNTAQQAVIEHQTQHISRLHQDLEELKLALSKKNIELSQYESSIAAKEKENCKLNGNIELLEAELEKKNNDVRLKVQEFERLRKVIQELRTEKEELVLQHAADLNLMRLKYVEENQGHVDSFTTEMKQMTAVHKEEKDHLKKEFEASNKQHGLKIQEVINTHQAEIERHEEKLKEVTTTQTEKAEQLENELEKQKERSEKLVESLAATKLEKEKLQSDMRALQLSLESSKQECENHVSRFNQLQVYVGQQQAEDYERSQWKSHKQEYEESILALQGEKESMTKTLELQNIRLQSITKILTTQEEAINANTKALSGGNTKGNPVHIIIRRWREKVFELMVQCRYNEISMKSTEDKWKLAEADLKEELEEEKRVSVILENQLSECKAQLEIQQRENGLLFTKCENLSNKLNSVTKGASQYEEALVSMSELVSKSAGQLYQSIQEKFAMAAEKTVYLEQRLVFANNRLRSLQDLLVRRENLWRAKMKGLKKVVEVPETHNGDEPRLIERPDLAAEIKRLTQERDALSQKLSMDSASYELSTAQFRERESNLEKEIASVQQDLEIKSEENIELKGKLGNMQEKLHDQERVVHDAKESERLAQEMKEAAIEEKLQAAQQAWDSERRKLEVKLEESQRERARTVVTSRQSERIAIREKKQASDNLEAVTREHKEEQKKLQARLQSLKHDNNLLMTTLRQNGLISTFKSARSKAKGKERACRSLSSSPQKQQSTIPMYTSKTDDCREEDPHYVRPSIDTMASDSENVAEMLKDLVVLTENLLEDSD